jgi:hypothetical protein
MSFLRSSGIRLVTELGARLPQPLTAQALRAADLVQAGRWLKTSGYKVSRWSPTREALWQKAAHEIADKKTLYLEFGVYGGTSIRHWSKLLKSPEARLQGFDSFEGLPEDWNAGHSKGTFDVSGQIPSIDDPRVEFFKGWFEETLPNHVFPTHDCIFINCDADLYSSTMTVLQTCKNLLSNGAYLYFDEFNECAHEMRAFNEFIAETKMKMALLGATNGLRHVLFQRVG